MSNDNMRCELCSNDEDVYLVYNSRRCRDFEACSRRNPVPVRINNIDLLLTDPVKWHKEQEKSVREQIADLRERIEELHKDNIDAHESAYNRLVSAGKIKEGDTAPWAADNRLYEFATDERERMSSIFESFLKSLGMR